MGIGNMSCGVAVLVQNLPENCERNDLVALACQYGDAYEVFLSPAPHPRSRKAPRDRFAVIKFRVSHGAQKFIDAMNGTNFNGNELKIVLSRSMEENDAEEAEIQKVDEEAVKIREQMKKDREEKKKNAPKQPKKVVENVVGSLRSKRVLDPDNEIGSEYVCTPAPPRIEPLLVGEYLSVADEIRNCGLEVSEVEVSDPRLVLFRMKLTRDMDAYSRAVKDALDRKAFLVPAPSQKVVRRCLAPQTRCVVEILMISPENMVVLKDEIIDAHQRGALEGPLLILPADDIERVKGIPLNRENAVSALCRLDVREVKRSDGLTSISHLFMKEEDEAKMEEEYQIIKSSSATGHKQLVGKRCLSAPCLVLDDVRSGDNVGALLRSAFSLGVRSIIMTKTSYSGLGMRAMRVSMGAASQCSFLVCENLPQVLSLMHKEMGIEVIATSPTAKETLSATRGEENQRWALVVGNEDVGSSQETFDAASRTIKLVQEGGDSFSVSIAASICLYILREPGLDKDREFVPDV
eukprot:GDKJ01009419.1.p1 GENE.GDKJ01009419.1~~GDKJ01009419.1.p1  ORF type:complete len:521 (-),score=125.11 GDKJ01009419.1:89-1651(-)